MIRLDGRSPASSCKRQACRTITDRVVTTVLALLSGVQHFAAQRISLPGLPAVRFQAAPIDAGMFVLWSDDNMTSGHLRGAIWDYAAGTVFNFGQIFQFPAAILRTPSNRFSMDCTGSECVIAYPRCMGFSSEVVARAFQIRNKNLVGDNVIQLFRVGGSGCRRLTTEYFFPTVCRANQCTTAFAKWPNLKLSRYRNGTHVTPSPALSATVIDNPGVAYAGSDLITLTPEKNIRYVCNLWTAEDKKQPYFEVGNPAIPVRPGVSLGCFRDRRCLGIWSEYRKGNWGLVGRFFYPNRTRLQWIALSSIGTGFSPPQFEIWEDFGVLAQSNATHIKGWWISDNGTQSDAFVEEASNDTSASNVPFKVRLAQGKRAFLFWWSQLINGNVGQWYWVPNARPRSTSQSTTFPISTPPASTQQETTRLITSGHVSISTAHVSAGIIAEESTLPDTSRSSAVTTDGLSRTTAMATPLSNVIYVFVPVPRDAPSDSTTMIASIVAGVVASLLCMIGAFTGLWYSRRRTPSDLPNGGSAEVASSGSDKLEMQRYSDMPMATSPSVYKPLTLGSDDEMHRYSDMPMATNPSVYKPLTLRSESDTHYVGGAELNQFNRDWDRYASTKRGSHHRPLPVGEGKV